MTIDVDESALRRTRGRRHQPALLNELERLRAALLAGHPPENVQACIARILAARSPVSEDAEIDRLLAEIELRAAVALAKLDVRTD